jgi:hypothetical protein
MPLPGKARAAALSAGAVMSGPVRAARGSGYLSRDARRPARPALAAAVAAVAVAGTVLGAAPRASADTGSTNQTGYQAAYVHNGTVWTQKCTRPNPPVVGGCAEINLGVAVAPGTSPSIAALAPSAPDAVQSGSSRVVWHGANGDLWTADVWISSASTPADTGRAMAPGTSPSVTGLTDGGWQAVYQASNGLLAWLGTSVNGPTTIPAAPGTSPSIAATPGARFQVVWQGDNNDLFSTGPFGTVDLGWRMTPGTSPALAEMANGQFAAAISAYNGPGAASTAQVTVGTLSNPASAATTSPGPYPGWGIAPGTSPAITNTPPTPVNPAGGWQIAFNGLDGRLWGDGALIAGPVTLPTAPGGFALAPGSSPAVNGIILPAYLGAGATPGYQMLYQDTASTLRDVVGSAFSAKYLYPLAGLFTDPGTGISTDSFQ